jgi:outer membrane protein OmpA-like peptidoglycan-associated protein
MKNRVLISLAIVLLLPGCWCKDKDKTNGKMKDKEKKAKEVAQLKLSDKLNIPLTTVLSDDADTLDEDLLVLFDDLQDEDILEVVDNFKIDDWMLEDLDDLVWFDDEIENKKDLDKVYFGFDQHNLTQDQKETLAKNISEIKETMAYADQTEVLIEGHACHSSGSDVYNLIKSEERAKTVKNMCVKEGIDKDQITIIGYGKEKPAINKRGSIVTGDRQDQWANRRVEMKVIHT